MSHEPKTDNASPASGEPRRAILKPGMSGCQPTLCRSLSRPLSRRSDGKIKSWRRTLVFRLTVAFLVFEMNHGSSLPASEPAPAVASELAAQRVMRVIDGDTVVLNRSGKLETCRMIGLAAPELNERFGPESAAYLRGWLEGKVVRVDYDKAPVSGKYARDRYGRLLVYLFADKGRELVNRTMIEKGLAKFERGYPTRYRKQFEAAEEFSMHHKIGLWQHEPSEALKAAQAEFARLRGVLNTYLESPDVDDEVAQGYLEAVLQRRRHLDEIKDAESR